MTRIYISGRMSGLPDFNFPAFNKAAFLLKTYGYEVENPADKGIIAGWTWAQYLAYDLDVMLKCQGLAMLPDWDMSRGARLEVHVALELGIPVKPVSDWVSEFVNPLADYAPGTVL